MTPSSAIDIHQHLWPSELIDALRARQHATPDGRLDAAAGRRAAVRGRARRSPDPVRRRGRAGTDRGGPVQPAGHRGSAGRSGPAVAVRLARRGGRAATGLRRLGIGAPSGPGPAGPRAAALADGFVGLQIPATWLATPSGVDRLAAVLAVAAAADRPVFVHPGPIAPVTDPADIRPDWWAAVVDYPSQMLAAWWSWHAVGRSLFPDLRICFAAGAGLAPVHHERYLARGGRPLVVDPAPSSTPRRTPARAWTA